MSPPLRATAAADTAVVTPAAAVTAAAATAAAATNSAATTSSVTFDPTRIFVTSSCILVSPLLLPVYSFLRYT